MDNRSKGITKAVDRLAKPDKKKVTDDGWHGQADESVIEEAAKWIAGAIKHPGALTRKAKAAGESNSEFEQQHKGDDDKTGEQARLAITLKKMHHESVDMTTVNGFAEALKKYHPDRLDIRTVMTNEEIEGIISRMVPVKEGLFGNPKQKHAFRKTEKKDEKKPEEEKKEKPVNEIALSSLKLFADSKNKMTNDKSKIDSKNDKVDKVKELVKKMREKK